MKTTPILKRLIQSCLFTFILTGMLGAQTYYVDTNNGSANNSNPGTEAQPWKTIQHAAETAEAGDQVFIRTGVYHENVYFDHSGTAGNPIVFSAYAGEKPVIDGTGVTESQNGVIIDKSYLKITGLEIRNWSENGIWIENSHDLEISDCEVHEVWYGIGMADGTHDFTLNRVVAHHFNLYGFDVSPSGGADCYNGTFNDCVAHTGRASDENVDGFALGHGTQHDFVLNRCVTYEVFDGFDISSEKSTMNGCLAYSCWNGGYKLWQDQVTLMNCIGYDCESAIVELDGENTPGITTITNCTFHGGKTYTIWIETPQDGLHMTNCILSGGKNIGLAFEQLGVQNYQGDYNIFQNGNAMRGIVVGYEDEFSMTQIQSGAWTTYSGQDAHSIVVDSDVNLFVNPGQADFHLKSESEAIDHGVSAGAPEQDYDNHSRPVGNSMDIGAYEYQSGTDVRQAENMVTPPQTCVLFQNYPNPFNPCTTISFELPKASFASLKVYNVLGEEVAELVSDRLFGGMYEYQWQATGLPGGFYFYQIEAEHFQETRKMLLLQ